MKTGVGAALLFAVFGVLNADDTSAPKRCCMPDQLEFTVGGSTGFTDRGRPGLTSTIGRVSMDFKKKMEAARVMGETDGKGFNVTIYTDFSALEMYTVDEARKTCRKTKLPSAEAAMQCVPKSAHYMGSPTMGLGTVLKTDSWMLQLRDEKSKTDLTMYFTMSSDSCVPISEGVIGGMGDLRLFEGISYYDVSRGIKDPSVFNIPDICKKDTVEPLDLESLSPMEKYMLLKQQMK